jgi:hypothetical protein
VPEALTRTDEDITEEDADEEAERVVMPRHGL